MAGSVCMVLFSVRLRPNWAMVIGWDDIILVYAPLSNGRQAVCPGSNIRILDNPGAVICKVIRGTIIGSESSRRLK